MSRRQPLQLKKRNVDFTDDLLEAIKKAEAIDDRPFSAEIRALLWAALATKGIERPAEPVS